MSVVDRKILHLQLDFASLMGPVPIPRLGHEYLSIKTGTERILSKTLLICGHRSQTVGDDDVILGGTP